MDISMLIKFIKFNLSEELPQILEMERESDGLSGQFGKRCRSPRSVHSAGSNSNYSV